MTSTVSPGRSRFTSIPEALRAWLRSACPSETKAIQFLTSPRDSPGMNGAKLRAVSGGFLTEDADRASAE
jgi:hypothetical protein